VVRREIVLEAPREEVWEAVTDPERLEEWFANDVELEVEPGGAGCFRWDDGTVRHAVVEEVEEERRLAFRWWEDEEAPSSVEVVLEDDPDGTRLTVTEAPSAEWSWALSLHASALAAAAA
jgi:uncharacterized protein YndB with AHSA1/START domain